MQPTLSFLAKTKSFNLTKQDPEITDLDPENPQDSRKINESIEKSTEKLEQEVTSKNCELPFNQGVTVRA